MLLAISAVPLQVLTEVKHDALDIRDPLRIPGGRGGEARWTGDGGHKGSHLADLTNLPDAIIVSALLLLQNCVSLHKPHSMSCVNEVYE